MNKSPIPENEVERLLNLGMLDLDYTDLKEDFKDIVALASKISGMEVSLINLIDPYTQWTVAKHGLDLDAMPREESVCQYTIMGDGSFEVDDLSQDKRFQDRPYVAGSPNLKYYFGIPLTTQKGVNIGALCVLDSTTKKISQEKIELLEIVAREVVNKLKKYNALSNLKNELSNASTRQKKIAQDVRDPLAGIIGITEILIEQESEGEKESLEFISLINESSKLILSITDRVLIEDTEEKTSPENPFNMNMLEEKLSTLYRPLAENKSILLNFVSEAYKVYFPIPKSSVLQIAGTLISSAINELSSGETITVELDIQIDPDRNILTINVTGNKMQAGGVSSLYKQAIGLASDLAKQTGGELKVNSQSNMLIYSFSLPYSA